MWEVQLSGGGGKPVMKSWLSQNGQFERQGLDLVDEDSPVCRTAAHHLPTLADVLCTPFEHEY